MAPPMFKPPSRINSRTKGHNGERELARLLNEELGDVGITFIRNLSQTRDSGLDLEPKPTGPFAIEVKRGQRGRIPAWWRQTMERATPSVPVALAYRIDYQDWRFRVALHVLSPYFNTDRNDLDWTCEISFKAFCQLVREMLP